MAEPRSVLITGASSGIGAALARAYAAPGRRLALGGRDRARLDATAALCHAAGAHVAAAVLDVTDRAAMAAWIAGEDDRRSLDLVIANAGISAGTGGGGESEAQVRRIFAANVDGVLNTIHPAIARMAARAPRPGHARGQIAIVSSLAGYRGFPGAPAYSASKAAVKVYGEALRGELKALDIDVSVVCPGYVATPMTEANDFPMPGLMSAERAAQIIVRGLARNRPRIAFPWTTAAGAWLAAALPPGWVDAILVRLPKKAAAR